MEPDYPVKDTCWSYQQKYWYWDYIKDSSRYNEVYRNYNTWTLYIHVPCCCKSAIDNQPYIIASNNPIDFPANTTATKLVDLSVVATTCDPVITITDKQANLPPHYCNDFDWFGVLTVQYIMCAAWLIIWEMYLKILKRWGTDFDAMLTIVNCGLHNIYMYVHLIAKSKRNIDILLRSQCDSWYWLLW